LLLLLLLWLLLLLQLVNPQRTRPRKGPGKPDGRKSRHATAHDTSAAVIGGSASRRGGDGECVYWWRGSLPHRHWAEMLQRRNGG
jgi:hypothetical protein